MGPYELEFTAYGFQASVVTQVPVQQGGTTKVDAQLEAKTLGELAQQSEGATTGLMLGGRVVSQSVTVAAASNLMHGVGDHEEKPMFTPSLRQYFPETLLWRPEVITDDKGTARIEFPLGDSITTWKMSLVASDLDGKVGFGEKDLRTFQPFQIEDDVPKVLTQGDRISLPLIIRNYSDRAESVTAELKPAPWFSMVSAPRQQVSVPPQSDSSAVFSIVAQTAIRKGTHQVSARNKETGDAIQREVAVHPDGQEISTSLAKLLVANDDTLDIPVPENAIAGSIDTELRIYPNLMAHLLDALHAVDAGYVSCPDIIASKGYGNLLVLQLLKKAGQDNADADNPRASLSTAARKSVKDTRNQLIGMQRSDGSYDYCFSYPKRSPISPTAYVLRFLNASIEFAPQADRKAISNAEKYLARQQRRSGAWLDYDWLQEKEVEDRNLTALTARALAEAAASAKGPEREEMQRPLNRAMNYLEDQIGSWQDAYLVGNYAIAAAISGRDDYIGRAQELLQGLAHTEGATTYWNLEANTSPFCNWGRSGRLETTALAVEALSLIQARNPNPDTAGQINRGLQFLLGHKDHRGSWYGGLVTQNVLAAIVAAMPSARERASSSQAATEATIMVNGHALPSIQLPPGNAVVGPVTVEIAEHLRRGINRVQIRRPGNASVMNAAAFTSYYLPWKDSSATAEENLQLGESRSLRLNVGFDQNNPAIGQAVRCHVEAERAGFRGYGMMMAEIGLPPGADADRESLDLVRSVLSYEVHPDRVVFYLWPGAGGVNFEFQFRLRYRMEATAAPSILYDYYNPESHAIVQPVRFTVH